jgi:hypothetical protein
MRMSRRLIAASGLSGAAMLAVARVYRPALAADQQTPAEAVEAFCKAMIASDHAAFDALCAAQLSCGHSGGKIQTKEEFIADATSQKAKWHALDDRLALGRAFLAGPCIIARCYV